MKLIDKDALVAEIKRRAIEAGLHDGVIAETREDECYSILSFLDTLKVKEVEVPVSKDLEETLKDYAYQVAYNLSNDWLKENATWDDVETAVKLGAQWWKEHLLKDAQSDDLPEVNKEVIALIEAFGHYNVIFAHRVAENAEVHTSIEGKPCVLHPKRYDKGGWNIPGIKWWLDIELPKTEK